MKFGVREICDVVLKAKANQKVGNKIFYKNEPVIYFDTLKTSSMEGAATTVYAQGGRGNSRLMAWEGERTVTFTMEDALISPAGFMILSGAGLIEAGSDVTIKQHITEQTEKVTYAEDDSGKITKIALKEMPYWKGLVDFDKTGGFTAPSASDASYTITRGAKEGHWIYVMALNNGEVASEPYIPSKINYVAAKKGSDGTSDTEAHWEIEIDTTTDDALTGDVVLVDYYTERKTDAQQIEITPDKFGGSYYLEASTLFRDTNGVDLPAEFIIPHCKIQSNFTFTMASSGDPSTFTFTMDAFPDYTRFDPTKKVLAAIQIIGSSVGGTEYVREKTKTKADIDDDGIMTNGTIIKDVFSPNTPEENA